MKTQTQKQSKEIAVGLLFISYFFLSLMSGGNSWLADSCESDRTGEDICYCGWHSLKRPTHTLPYNSALQLSLTGQMRNRPLRDILALRGGRAGGRTRPAVFVCRQMASCLLKKSLEERPQKVVTQQALFSFQCLGSFIPARLCESSAERTPLWVSTWNHGKTAQQALTQ